MSDGKPQEASQPRHKSQASETLAGHWVLGLRVLGFGRFQGLGSGASGFQGFVFLVIGTVRFLSSLKTYNQEVCFLDIPIHKLTPL